MSSLKILQEIKEKAYGTSGVSDSDRKETNNSAQSVLEEIKSRANGTYKSPDKDSDGKRGYQKYLSDIEQAQKEAAKAADDEKWWERLFRYLGDTQDTSLPMANTTQTIKDLREDVSYKRPNDDWSEAQRLEFGSLYLESPEKAYEYAEKTNNANNKAKEEAEIEKVQDSATSGFWAGAGHTLGAIATAPLGMADYLSDLAMANAGRDIAPDGHVSPFEYSQAVTEGVATDLNERGGVLDERIPVIGGKGWGDVYGLGTSIAQSIASAYALGPGGVLVSYFGQGAAAGVDEALERGASEEQAVLYGTALGVFEGLAENIGVDNLFKLGASSTVKGFIKNVVKQAGAEGVEEGLTSLFSNIADNVIVGEKSNFYALVGQYVASGMSESEAKNKAWLDLVEGVAFDTIAGAVSGGVSGGIHTTANTIGSNINAKKLYGDSSADLINKALELGGDAKALAEEYQAKLDGGKKLSGANLKRLVEANENTLRVNDTSKITSAVEARLTALGEKGDVAKLAEILAKQASGESLTLSEKAVLKNSTYGQRVANELNPSNIESGQYASAWAENIGTERINAEAYGRAKAVEEASASKNTPVAENATEGKFGASTEVKHTIEKDGKEVEVKIARIASIENGEMTVELEDGSVVNAGEVNYGAGVGLVYQAAADMASRVVGFNTDTANVFVKGFNPQGNLTAAEYMHGFSDAYRYGTMGYPVSELESGVYTSKLTDEQRTTAYNFGKAFGNEKVAKKQAKIASTVTIKPDKNATKAPKKGKGRVHFDGSVVGKNLNERQKASLKALGVVAESLGIDIHVFESPIGKDGTRQGANGWYDPKDNSIHIDLYAGREGDSLMLFTASHELTHFIREWSPAKFKTLADFLLEEYNNGGKSVEELIRIKKKSLKANGRITSDMTDEQVYDLAYEEVIADSCEAMLTDSNAIETLAKLKAKDKGLFDKIKEFISKLVARIKEAYDGLNPDSAEANYVREMKEAAEKLQKLWTEALVDASEASNLVEINTESKSVSPMFSERTWTASEYVTEREETAKKISNALGVDMKTAYKYIDDINGVARLIADDRARLDYEPNLDDRATVLKPNSEYKYSVDMSTLCAKRLLFTGTFDAIQRALPNKVFDSEDIVALREMMQKRNYEVACGICYVESTRREIGRITQDFIDSYKEAQKTGKPITRVNSEGKVVDLKKTKDQKETTADKSTDKFFAEKGYTPTLADLNTTDIDLVKRDHPLVYEAYLNFMNARGQAKPKLLETRAEYKGEILKHFKYTSAVNARNNAGGLRLQSFSDFEVPHMIDMMQIVMDMSRVGLKSQAYTKVPAFAEVFGDTGVKINLSLIAKGDGLDSNGNLVFDDVEGINHNEAFKLRDKYSKNVGTILVGKTDAHIIAAMADPRIDYIIPFHKSSWKESLYDALGLTGYADYTDFQNEKSIDGSKIKNYDPSEYWDFSKTGDENAQIYLAKCREDGRIPKFSQFQGYPGYWKLLIDFKMYDNDGVGAPQEVVMPIFNTEASEKILREYKGGHKSFPVAKDVVEDFVKEHKGNVKYSDRYLSADENSDILSMTARVESGEFKANEKVFLGQVTDGIAKQIQDLTGINVHGFKVAIEARQIAHILKDHGKNGAADRSMANPSDIAKIEYALNNYDDIRLAGKTRAYKQIKNGQTTWSDTVLYEKGIGGKSYYVVQAVPDTNAKTLYIVTAFIGKEGYKKEASQFIDVKNPDVTPKSEIVNTSTQIISQSDDSVKRKYSDRDTYAPTFYSHMGKVIDGIRLEKMGAGGVVSYLKGKGVKDEEIKWSGIETFLEGKKSVTKEELQEFVAGSQLQIEEETSGIDIELRYDHSTDSYTVLDENGDVIDTYSYDADRGGYASENDDEVYEYASDLEKEMRWVHGVENAPRHSQYKLDGGSNYREIVFKLPDSSYSNDAMRGHWGEDAEGVLAHARIQDMTTSGGKKMLFIEEIQSDWHNEGRQIGYADRKSGARIDELQSIAEKKFFAVEDYSTEMTGLAGEWETIERTEKGAKLLREYREAQHAYDKAMNEYVKKIPDAPFRDTYHEYVLKRLLRMASEEGYDSIGWTTADIQSERWSDDYAEAYRIEYDQDIPKFLRKYGKRWGATVGKTTINGDTEVWSMGVTSSMKNSVLYEGQAVYSDRSTDSFSNRSLLANALESAAQNDIERRKLEEYKSKISLINSEEQKLRELREKIKELSFAKGPRDTEAIKKLQFEANQAANRINTYDRQLLNLESTKALKGVLDREKEQARKRAEQRSKESLARYKERAAKTQRELMTRYQESRNRATEGRHKTAMRHKIKDIVSELNTLLLKPTAKKHIKEELRKEVADALSAINMDTVDADARVAKYNALIARESDPDVIAELTRTRDNIQFQGETLKEKLVALQNAYEKIKATDDIELSLSYQEVIHNSIKNVTDKVGNTSIRNMTLEQLEMVYDLFKMIRHTIRDANKSFKAKKGETIMQMAEAVNDQVRTVGGQPYKHNFISSTLRKIGWTFLKPYVAFRTIGSVTLTNMYKELRHGEDVFYEDVKAAQAFIEEQYEKHNYKSWDMKKTKEFTAKSGKSFKLTLEQMMSLYAYSRREQAHKHIIEGGIVFEDALIVEKNKWGIPIKYEVTTKDAFNLSEETFEEIANSLTAEQKAFVDAMQDYLSTVMGEKGNEVSMELLGVKLFKEKFYLPIKSSQYYRNFSAEEAGEVKLKSPAFSKETVTHANNPIVIHNFTDLWAEHINDMSMYHSFVLALEDFTRVYNYKTKTDAKVETMDTKATLETAYPGVTKYISKFLKDMNGGVRGETVGWAEKLTSLAKKGSVLGSASVAIQQPSAVMRAMAMVNPKYFATTAHKSINLAKHKQDFEELKKYAPVAGIKEMGRFDVGMGQGTVDWIQSNKNLLEKGEDILSAAPAFMDEVTWVSIWNAVKRETAHNNPNLKTNSDEFLELAGERFTDVISMTQVYDSVFSRSDIMRNKSWIAKALTAFMAEPTTTLNMIWDGWVQAKRVGGFKAYAKATVTTGGPIVASIVLNAALKSIVLAMRDDDEDESYAEKYLESFFGDLKDNLNPLTLVPFVKDIVSIYKGYDVERMDMALFSDLKRAIDAFDSDSKTAYEKWSGLIGAISALFGVPVKNVERDVRGLIKTIFGKTEDTTAMGVLNAIEEGWSGNAKSNGQQLYEAMVNGDTEQIERVKGRFENQTSIDSALRKALRDNDPRIKQAAEARFNGDIAEYMRIAKEIIAEGNFSQDNIVAAINSEVRVLMPDEEKEETADKVKSIFEVSDFFTAVRDGDAVTAYTVREEIIDAYTENGKDREEAESDFNSKFASHVREQYEDGNISVGEAKEMLMEYGGKSEEDASSKVQYWAFRQKYPDYDLSEEAVKKYYSDVEPTGISVDVYYDYSKQRSNCKGTDSDGDGKTDSGSVKAEVLNVINSLPILSYQKDALYYLNGWAESTIWQAPWH